MSEAKQATSAQHTRMIVSAARVMCARNAHLCGVNEDDNWTLYAEDFKADAEKAFAAAGVPELLDALLNWLGTPDDPKAGWHGSGGTNELFACEYCNAKHGDCAQIAHKPTCPIPQARAAIAKATGSAA